MNNIIRDDIQQMTAYQVADLPSDFIKLDAMEVPYQFPPSLQQELAQELAQAPINRYPNPHTSGLQEILRQVFDIPKYSLNNQNNQNNQEIKIALGNGSDELIQLLTMLVAKPNATVLALEPSFVMYQYNAKLLGLNYVGVPLNSDFSLNLNSFLDAIEQYQPALIWLAYPNNPTGVAFEREQIQKIIEQSTGLVVIDEAYGAFSQDSFLQQAGTPENLIVLRTLSKIGFAGLRLGYAVGNAKIMNELAKIIPPYNMNHLSLTAAKFALKHIDWINEHILILKNQRVELAKQLLELNQEFNQVQVFPSEANFITVRVPNANQLFDLLKENKILVKKLHGSHPLLDNCLRLTIGTPEQNQAVLSVFKQLLLSK